MPITTDSWVISYMKYNDMAGMVGEKAPRT